MARRLEQGRVVENREVGAGIYRIGVESPGVAQEARPGQFCMARVGCPETGDPLLRRPFSIHDVKEGVVWLLYRVVGRGTRLLSTLSPGDPLELLGPLGRPFPPASGPSILFVAGGMGVAPLAFLARERGGVEALIGARSREEVVLTGGVEQRCASLMVATEDGSMGRRGLVTSLLPAALDHLSDPLVFTCGPMPMMRAVWEICRDRGVRCYASLEQVMACGVGLCKGCAVERAGGGYLHVCTEGPVVEAGLVAW